MIVRRMGIGAVTAALLAGSLFFAGCGGGDDAPPTVTAAGVELTGTAVDELILNGKVQVREGSASGNIIGEGRTSDTDGTYTIDVGDFKGVAVVKVTCDADSELYFPATGKKEPCPLQTELFSAASVESEKVTVNVAPATHVMFMMATGGNVNAVLDKTRVEEARQITANIFGADPIADDPTEGVYAKVIEAFHEAADDANISIQEFVDDIADDASDGILGDDTPQLVADLAQSMSANSVTTELVTAIVENNQTTYVPDDSPVVDDIAAAKALFASLRSQAYSLYSVDQNSGLLYDEAKALQSVLESTTFNVDLAGSAIGNIASLITLSIDSNLTANSTTVASDTAGNAREINVSRADLDASVWNYEFYDNIGGNAAMIASGSVTLPSADPAADINLSSLTDLYMAIDGTLPENYFGEQVQNVQQISASIHISPITDGMDLNVSDIVLTSSAGSQVGLRTLQAQVGYDFNESDTVDPFTLNYIKLTQVGIGGVLGQDYTAEGVFDISYTISTPMQSIGVGFKDVWVTNIEGYIACIDSDGNYIESYGGDLKIDLGDGNIVDAYAYGGNLYTRVDGIYENIDPAVSITYTDSCSIGSPVLQYFNTYSYVDDMIIGNSGYIPESVLFKGEIANLKTGTAFNGSIGSKLLNAADIDINRDNEAQIEVTLSGTLKRSGMGDMLLNLSYSYDPATTQNRYEGSYSYDNTLVTIDGEYNEASKEGRLDIGSGAGVGIKIVTSNGTIDLANTTPVTKDGKEIGRLDNETGIWRIKYYDGSFESLY